MIPTNKIKSDVHIHWFLMCKDVNYWCAQPLTVTVHHPTLRFLYSRFFPKTALFPNNPLDAVFVSP